jgi:hypothetical protein
MTSVSPDCENSQQLLGKNVPATAGGIPQRALEDRFQQFQTEKYSLRSYRPSEEALRSLKIRDTF